MIDIFLKGRRNPRFTGRNSILKDLEDGLDEGVPVVLTGPDGMGKSAIAEEHGRVHVTNYNFRFWVRAREATVLASDYAAIASLLEISHQEDSDIGDLAESVRTWLEENGRWLVVFDDAPSPEALENYLPLPKSRGDVIITSKNSGWEGAFSEIEVGPLETAEAAAFLQGRTGQEDQAASEKLAELLVGDPLALELAGAYIKWTGISLSKYLDAYKRRSVDILDLTPPGFSKALAAVMAMTIEQVGAVSQEGIDLLSLSAFLAPEDLPVDLLVKAAALLPESVESGLLALDRRGLVRRDGETLSVHPLIQDLAYSRLDDEKRKIWADETARAVGAAFSTHLEDLSTWTECARLLPHALASTEKVEELGIGSEPASLLLNQVGLYLHRRGYFVGARDVLERLIVLDERLFGPGHPEVATDLNNLGSVLRVLDDLAGAKRCFERALTIEEEQDSPDRLKIAIRANNLGTVLRSLGDLEGALDQFERALAIDRDAYGPNHLKTAIRLNNRGDVLLEMGDPEGAKDSYQRALRIFEQFLGPGHHYTQRARENLDTLSQNEA